CIECINHDGIRVTGGVGTTIRGLAIVNFDHRGIVLAAGSSNSIVEGSWLGIDQFGPGSSAGNELGGIRIEGSAGNRIGGPLPEQRVSLGSNGNFGGGQIEITGLASGNVVQGSYIGLNPDGAFTYDTEDGVLITSGASGNTIGGDSGLDEGNLVYGFYGRGVVLDGAGADNVIAGNTIGLSEDGAIGEAPEVGIDVVASPDNDIGDSVSPPGFANPSRGNVVVGADTVGIQVGGGSGGTRIAGNFVGVHRSISSVDFGNFDGIVVVDSGVTIGPGNTIAFNTANGVEIDNEVSAGNRIVANSIHDNGGLGIDLQSFANNGLAAPTITSATTAGAATTVDGTVTAPAGTYFVEFFTNDDCDTSGAGEGETYVGFATAVVDGSGSGSYTQDVPALPVGTVLTATATSAATNDTSEFSTCATVAAGSTETVVTLEPVADTYVSGTQPDATFGSADHFDTYGGFSASCVPHSAPAYGLLRFNLSTLPTGQIADAKIVLTSRAGYAQDGDGNHHVIRLSNDSWTEAGVTWNTRPPDGTVAPGNPLDATGNDIRLSNRALGADFVWRSSCGTDFAGNQTKVFPTNSEWTKTFAAARADMIAAVTAEQDGDDLLSVEIYNPNCASCPGGANKAYWARYYSREAADPALRPKLVVTYEAASVDVTSYNATPADPSAFTQIATADVPASVLLARPSNTASSPLGDTPLGDTPLGDTPLGDTPLGDTPLGDTSLGLANVIAELRTVPLSSLPLLRAGGWPAVLANTTLASRALQNVSLGEVFLLTPRPAVLDGQGTDDITLADLDFSRSSLGDVVTIAYALGNGVTLAELEGAFSNGQLDPDLQRWCTVTNTNCSATSILALGLRGAPLGDTPLGDTPLGDTPLGDTPLGDTPLGDTPLGDTPLGDTPLGDTPLGDTPLGDTDFSAAPLSDTPLGDTPLGDTPLGDTPLGDTPLGDTPLGDTQFSAIAICAALFTDCPNDSTDTLRDHRQFLRSGVTISDLIAALTPAALASLTLSDVLDSIPDEYAYTLAHAVAVITDASDLTLADLVASLPNPNDFTLNDLLAAVLRAGAQWERIDLAQPELARVATGSDVVSLAADLTISGFTSSPLTFRVDLPRGWTPAGTPPWIESVPPGAATTLELVSVERTPDGGTRHTLRTQFAVGGNQRVHFDTKPGATLGLASPSLAVTVAGNDPVAAPAAFVDVQEAFEPANNDPATAPILAPDRLYVSHLTSATDTDYYRVTVPATGTRTTIHLSHLPEDYDLVVYGRQGATPLVSGGDAPPLETPVLGDSGAGITHLTDALPAETLDDLALLDRQVLGVSAFRTTEDEAVVAISDGAPGEYVVQVTGYNGASSVDPYMLRVESKAPRLAPTCQLRYPGVSFGSAPGVSLAAIPADVDTLFLANGPQLAAGGGQSVLDWFSTTNLTALRNTGHPSALVRLQDDPAVRSAYIAWNLQPCSTARANAVVTAITTVLRNIRAARPALRHVVLLGADTALPFARLDDLTTIANEADYASTFARTDDLYGALFEHKVLSDDPYATTDPIPYLQRQLFVPQLAVGRLVETAAQITGTLDRFLAFGGVLDPSSARTSGYDFLKDGANGVAAAFADVVGAPQPATTPPLIGDLWTRFTLRNALGTNTGLFGMNGHADHGRLQPARDADGDGVFASTDLFSAADLPASLERAVVFSMGCHSGLSASDASVAGAAAADWAQAFAGKGAAAYAGNLGYGYGDTVTVAYSEALNVRLAEGLRDGLPIGEALVEAKQGYLADLGL
ncbi:MAG TPA: DNRLRE domain-containing protein, partial [Gaiellaceae bacterium]|nr:DNRLRE domain-containing protein [Gaiellaceae bacterium]